MKTKKGISLIVLVITIIVMIILASAIILSLNSSDIIGKANKAKTASNAANVQEMVSILKAEWLLLPDTERVATPEITYVNNKLAEKGYEDYAVTADNKIVSGGESVVTRQGVQIGDYVVYKQPDTQFIKTENGITLTYDTPMTVKWKYMGVDEEGKILLLADRVAGGLLLNKVDTSIYNGYEAWEKGPDLMHEICRNLYSNSDWGTGRSITVEDVNKLLGYTEDETLYKI